jgi:hypothetical protein
MCQKSAGITKKRTGEKQASTKKPSSRNSSSHLRMVCVDQRTFSRENLMTLNENMFAGLLCGNVSMRTFLMI